MPTHDEQVSKLMRDAHRARSAERKEELYTEALELARKMHRPKLVTLCEAQILVTEALEMDEETDRLRKAGLLEDAAHLYKAINDNRSASIHLARAKKLRAIDAQHGQELDSAEKYLRESKLLLESLGQDALYERAALLEIDAKRRFSKLNPGVNPEKYEDNYLEIAQMFETASLLYERLGNRKDSKWCSGWSKICKFLSSPHKHGKALWDEAVALLPESRNARSLETSKRRDFTNLVMRWGNMVSIFLERPVQILLSDPESESLEKKSSLMWDYKYKEARDIIGHESAIAMAAFMNARGGTVLIGVHDDGNVMGLSPDFKSLHETGRSDEDSFERRLMKLVEKHLGLDKPTNIHLRWWTNNEGMRVAVIKVDAGIMETYCKNLSGVEEFFVRHGNLCQKYDLKTATQYIRTRFPR